MERVIYVCDHCGSDDVRADAYAQWDVDAQEWTVSATFPNYICEDCGGETRVSEKPLADKAED